MSTAYALRDSTTMLRRDLRHLQRYPGLSMFPILMPVVLLLLFVYVFGGTLGDGIKVGGGRGAYINFLTPGMLLFTVVGAAQITAISVAKDMTEGIIARFKTMRIWRPAVLAGHVFSSLILTLINLSVTIAVALLTRRLDARRPTLVRRESALHPDHRHRAQRARQPARRQRRRQGDPVVPRDHRRQLSLGQVSLQ